MLLLAILTTSPLSADNFTPFKSQMFAPHDDALRGTARMIADIVPLAYYSLATYYITPPDFKKMSLSALQKATMTIPTFKFKNVNDHLQIYLNSTLLHQTPPLPAPEDYKNWSIFLVKIFDHLDEQGALPHSDTDHIMTALLSGLTKDLDKMTKYIPPPYIKGQIAAANKKPKRNQSITTQLYKDIFYIHIPHFLPKSFPEMLKKVREANRKYKGVILDLRENFGGDLFQAIEVADAFLGKGMISTSNGRHPEAHQKFFANTQDFILKKPMAVLVNRNSASASEVLAAALKDTGRAVIIGKNTYGKGTIQRVVELPNGGSLNITWAKLHSPKGISWDKKGLTPHIDTRNAKAFLARLEGYEVPSGLDHDMRTAYVILKTPGLYKEAMTF